MRENDQPRLGPEAAGLRSPDQAAALRLAAVLLVVNVLVLLLVCLLLRSTKVPLIQIVVALGLAPHLYLLRPNAEAWTLGLAAVAGVISPLVAFRQYLFLAALGQSLPVWGLSLALFLLLIGEPRKARRIAAVALYVLLTVGIYALAVAGQLSRLP